MQSLVCPANLEPRKIKLLLGWLPFILLLSETFLWLSRCPSNCSLLSLQITMSSANTVARGESCLTYFFSMSVAIANKMELRADLCSCPTSASNSSVTPHHCLTALTHVLHHSNILSCHSRLTHAILQILIFSFVWLYTRNHPNLLHIHLCLENLRPTQCPTCHTSHCPPLPMIPLPDSKDDKCQCLTS